MNTKHPSRSALNPWLGRLLQPIPTLGPAACAVALLLSRSPAHAASDTWNQNAAGTSYLWNDTANWLSGTQVPGSTTSDSSDVAFFGKLTGAETITVDNPRYIGGITFTNAAAGSLGYTLAGGPLILNSGGTIQTLALEGAHADTISAPVTIDGTSGGTATFNSSGSVNGSLMNFSGGVNGVATAGNTTTLTLTGTIGSVGGSASVISGNISDGPNGGTLALVKTGTGAWYVNAAGSTFSGGTTVQTGTLGLNVTPGTPLGTGPLTIAGGTVKIGNGAPRSLTLGGLVASTGPNTLTATLNGGSIITLNVPSGNLVYAGQLGGTANSGVGIALGVLKIGAGTQTFSGVNYYTNTTKINNGKLIGVTGGSCVNSAVTVQSSGGGSAATLGVSYTGADAQWTCASLTTLPPTSAATAAPVLEFIFNTAPSTAVAPLNVTGTATLDSSTTVTVDLNSIGLNGNYPLMVVGGTAPTTVPALTVNGGYTGCSLAWGTAPFSANTLVLTVASAPREPLTWNTGSAGSGTWDINNSGNLVWNDVGANPTYYQDNGIAGDQVVFDQTYTTANTVVALNSVVTPSSIAVTNPTINYTISGTGSIAGTTTLSKNGAGTLTLATTNTYSGLTTVNAGELDLNASAGPAVSGNMTVSGGTAKLLQANQINSARNLAVSSGVFDLQGNNQTLAGVQLTGGSLNGSGGTLTSTTAYDLQAGSVSAILGGTVGVNKTTTGTITFTGANTYTGATTVNQGVLTVGGGGAINSGNTANLGLVTVGSAAGTATLNINGGTVNATAANGSSIRVGTVSGANGVINLTSGTLNTAGELWLGGAGPNGPNGFGCFNMSGGTATLNSYFDLGRCNSGTGSGNSRGEFNLSGGSLTVATNNLEIGSIYNLASNTCVATLTGGSLTVGSDPVTGGFVYVGRAANGVLSIYNNASLTMTYAGSAGTGLLLGNSAGATGILNLNGGTATVSAIYRGAGTGYVNFNGGTLASTRSLNNFMSGLTAAYVYAGGAVINDGGYAINIAQPLLSPAVGNGVSASGLTVGGSGFIAPPIVDVIPDPSDTTGAGASAIATIDGSGNLTGVVMTSPGVGYTAPPSFMFTGGGGTATQSGSATLVPNTSGGLVKLGANTLTLSGANTYTGLTTVSNGTLRVTGSLAAGADVKSGAILAGSGTIGGPVTVEAGATLQPGTGGAATATLTINGNLSLAGTTLMTLNTTNTPQFSQVAGVNALSYGGTLTVTNAGPDLVTGTSFQLFSASTASGNFSATNLPALASGLSWNWNPANGTLSVVGQSLPATGTNIQFSVSGNQLTLSWPANYTGWLLQSNSIDLANTNDWFTVPGSDTTNQEIITVDPGQAKVFYRMLHP